MHLTQAKNNSHKNVLVTSQDLYAGLPFAERIESCAKIIQSRAKQFMGETSILLEMARNGASTYVSCEAENDTDICAFLAQLDIEVGEIAEKKEAELRALTHNS